MLLLKVIALKLLIIITLMVQTVQAETQFKINQHYTSTNFDSRIRQIIIHHTAGHTKQSMQELLGKDVHRDVSAHYLINDKQTQKYPDTIYQLVPEQLRSWHAGISSWYHDTDLNNSSIGIEIVNMDGNDFKYTEKQIDAVIFICRKIKSKYGVKDINIIGHSDIAPTRKIDPGTLFPWKKLHENGCGAWYDQSDINDLREEIKNVPNKDTVKTELIQYGYNPTAAHSKYSDVVKAFQRHFSPQNVTGFMDRETYIILRAMLRKYRKYK